MQSCFNFSTIAITGGIGSGKTALTKSLADSLCSSRVSFGDYVRTIAARRSLQSERKILQDLGEQLIIELGTDAFVKEVINFAAIKNEWLIIDGIRHVEVWLSIQKLFPQRSWLIYIDIDESIRIKRLVERDKLKEFEALLEMSHTMEKNIYQLVANADIVLKHGSVNEMVSTVLSKILPP